jgi:hypothetical protein
MAHSPARADRSGERWIAGLLVLGCVLLIVAGLALSARGGGRSQPIVVGDVSHAQTVEVRNSRGETVLSGEFRSRVGPLGETEKDAALYDRRGKIVIGEVEIEIPAASRPGRRTELEIDVIGLAPRETFTLVVDDRPVGTFETDDRGSVDMELQEGERPFSVPGS